MKITCIPIFSIQRIFVHANIICGKHQTKQFQDKPIKMLYVKRTRDTAQLPVRATPFSAGMDLFAAVPTTVLAGGKAIVFTGISIACPEGTYARIAPRSGLAVKNHIDVGAGVVDSDYRGEVGVVLFNLSSTQDFVVNVGDRIAQLVLEKIMIADVVECEGDLDETIRGDGGFGSSGV